MGDTGGHAPGKTPVWQAIAQALRADIAEGRFARGDKLPTEAALAARFGVNRHTVRHGLAQLVEEGLVRTRRGAGAFVAAEPTDYPLSRRVSFTENLRRAGRQPGRQILSLETRAASVTEAEALAVQVGDPVLAAHGLSSGDGQPMSLSESLYPLDRLPGIAAALKEERGVTHALRAVGVIDFLRAWTRITAQAANATQALHLQVLEGAPLLCTRSLNVDGAGVPVELGTSWWPGERVTLTLEE